MISEFNPDYDPRAQYRFITLGEYLEDTFSKKNWCDPNMNFLFGVDVSADIASYLYKNKYLEGDLYSLNPDSNSSNHTCWVIFKEFLRKKETKPLVSIPSIL